MNPNDQGNKPLFSLYIEDRDFLNYSRINSQVYKKFCDALEVLNILNDRLEKGEDVNLIAAMKSIINKKLLVKIGIVDEAERDFEELKNKLITAMETAIPCANGQDTDAHRNVIERVVSQLCDKIIPSVIDAKEYAVRYFHRVPAAHRASFIKTLKESEFSYSNLQSSMLDLGQRTMSKTFSENKIQEDVCRQGMNLMLDNAILSRFGVKMNHHALDGSEVLANMIGVNMNGFSATPEKSKLIDMCNDLKETINAHLDDTPGIPANLDVDPIPGWSFL